MMDDMKKMLVVARYTFNEIIKSKILINVILLGFGLVVVSFVAAELTYGVPGKVAIDLGLGMLSLSAVVIAIFMGVSLLSKEIESRTIYVVLSRPVGRVAFLVGKILGMSVVLFINVAILGVMSILLYLYLGGDFSGLIIYSILFAFLEAVLVLVIVVCFSLITNNYLAVIFTISVWILGHAMSDTLVNRFLTESPVMYRILKISSVFLPNFSNLSIKDYVLYQQMLPTDYLIGTSLYSLVYFVTVLFISVLIFSKKSLD